MQREKKNQAELEAFFFFFFPLCFALEWGCEGCAKTSTLQGGSAAWGPQANLLHSPGHV